jgi:hypothetical protein
LKHQPPGMPYQPPTGLDQPGLMKGQRPALHRLRQGQPSDEVGQTELEASRRLGSLVRLGAVVVGSCIEPSMMSHLTT